MSDFSLLGQLDQASGSEAVQIFRSFIREHVRDLICQVMAQEVSLLCGPKHQPTGGDKFRSGSSTGGIQIDGKRQEIISYSCPQPNLCSSATNSTVGSLTMRIDM